MIENEILSLRALEPSDAELLYVWENDPEVWKVSNTIAPFSKAIIDNFIAESKKDIYQSKELRLMIDRKEDMGTIGCVDIFDFEPLHKRAALGILIDPAHREKGYAKKALRLAMHYCFDFLLLHQLYCNVGFNNEKSIVLFKSLGFEVIGLKKAWNMTPSGWEDEIMMQFIKNEKES